MANKYGYLFYFADGEDVMEFPITPSELSIKVGSKNETVTLINEGEINILKSPSLIEVEFEARFPMSDTNYPFARATAQIDTYLKKFEELKEKRKPFRFKVVRSTLRGKRSWDTDILVALESYDISESADEGDDVLISFQLKQYKPYGIKVNKQVTNSSDTTSTSKKDRDSNKDTSKSNTYTVKTGDCLWKIAKQFYGNGAKWKTIYDANKSAIEADAKKHGYKSSSNGHWIWAGLKLTIPPLK